MSDTPFLCPIWNTDASRVATLDDGSIVVDSERAGGRYRISAEAIEDNPNLKAKDRAIITTWIVEQRRSGVSVPQIGNDIISPILERRPLRFREQRNRFFQALGSADFRPGDAIVVVDEPPRSQTEKISAWRLMAFIGAETFREMRSFLQIMVDEGFLKSSVHRVSLTARGFEEIDALQDTTDTLQAFVAMWFDSEMKESWRTGFAPAIRDAGYEPFRIDGLQHNGKIDDEIVAQIKKSRFLVADFTCGGLMFEGTFKPNPRGGVYYEAGLAHGLGMEVIFTCREDRMDFLHFDTRQFAHIVWQSPIDLRSQLYNRIAATLKEAPNAPGPGRGSVDPNFSEV